MIVQQDTFFEHISLFIFTKVHIVRSALIYLKTQLPFTKMCGNFFTKLLETSSAVSRSYCFFLEDIILNASPITQVIEATFHRPLQKKMPVFTAFC